MKYNFILRMHDNTPSGGRKVTYSYANYLASIGQEVQLTFVADASFKNRHHNTLASIKHGFQLIKGFHKQNKITWFPLNRSIKIRAMYRYNGEHDDDENVILFDFALALHIANTYHGKLSNFVYFIQADERVYYDSSIVEEAWNLPVRKIVVSNYLKMLLAGHGVASDNICVVPNYIDQSAFYLTKQINERLPVVSFLNHSARAKGTAEAIEIVDQLKKTVPSLRVIMFGNPDAPKNIPFDYEYFQSADEDTLREKIYNESSIFVSPSRSEGWGLTASEAMACGALLVSYDNGGIDDFATNNVSAIIYDDNNKDELVQRILYLIQNDSERVRIALAGYNSIQKFSKNLSCQAFQDAVTITRNNVNS